MRIVEFSGRLHATTTTPLDGSSAAEDPWSIFNGTGNDMLLLLALIPVAVVVIWFGSRQFRGERSASSLRPKGRTFVYTEPGHRGEVGDRKWRQTVARLEARATTPIAQAIEGPVRLEARIVNASGNLGGFPGRECVWRNRAGGRPQSAIGAELVIVADGSGRCGVENLEAARVIAPAEQHSVHHESVSLQLGDEVELFGMFTPEKAGEDPDPSKLVYGTLGSTGALEVRLVRRPPSSATEASHTPHNDATAGENS